jgi:hypothetical protein
MADARRTSALVTEWSQQIGRSFAKALENFSPVIFTCGRSVLQDL